MHLNIHQSTIVQKARDHMEHMDEKNKRMQLERANHKKLSDEVQNVVVSIHLYPTLFYFFHVENKKKLYMSSP